MKKLLQIALVLLGFSAIPSHAETNDFVSGGSSLTDRYSAKDSMARRNLHEGEIIREFRDGNCWVKVQRYWDDKHNQFFTREIRDCS